MTPNTLNISSILHEVAICRSRENLANVFKVFGVVVLALFLAWLAMVIAGQGQPQAFAEAAVFIASLMFGIFVGIIICAINFVILFWPFLLYFWANVAVVRQRTLLSLIQTALETGTPLPSMIRTHAAGFCLWYGARLNRFAAALDSGSSLEEAVRGHWRLFRYDVAGMIRLGGNTPETLRAVEEIAQDERDFSIFKTSQTIRAVYLLAVVCQMLTITSFVFLKIIPQFEAIFLDFNTSLPGLTLFVIAVAQWFVMFWWLFVPLAWLIGIAFLVYLILQTNVVIFRPWGFRRTFRNTDAAKFLAICAVGIQHRFPIPAILDMYRWTAPSEYLRQKGRKIQQAIEKGRDWIESVRHVGFVSSAEASLLKSAERTGNTPAVLDQLARSKERRQIREDELYSKLVFIPLVLLLGAIVGVLAIAMFMPIVKLITDLSY